MKTTSTFTPREHQTAASDNRGFTLVELLTVLATLALLAIIALPTFAGARPNSQSVQCLNNTRQLTLAWQMYAADNYDRMIGSGWVGGSMAGTATAGLPWTSSGNESDPAYLTNSSLALMAGYVKNPAVYKCPSDKYQAPVNPGPRVRSYGMNAATGGNVSAIGGTYAPDGPRTYIKNTIGQRTSILNKPGPSKVWVFLDEHPDNINDATFQFRPGYQPTAYQFQDLPGSLHNGGCAFSFADGHSMIEKWSDSRTTQPVRMLYKWWATGGGAYQVGVPTPSVDYEWLNKGMPYE